MSKFVEEVTTYKIKDVVDGYGPDYCLMSVVSGHCVIDLVIGAQYRNKCAASLSKEGVGQLISILQDIEKAMP